MQWHSRLYCMLLLLITRLRLKRLITLSIMSHQGIAFYMSHSLLTLYLILMMLFLNPNLWKSQFMEAMMKLILSLFLIQPLEKLTWFAETYIYCFMHYAEKC